MSDRHITELWPEPPKGRTERVKHFLDVFNDLPDDYMILLSTAELYGRHTRTGVSMGDLRYLYELDRRVTELDSQPDTGPAKRLLGSLEKPEETGAHRPHFSD